jgi:hypothetical protein
MFFESSYIGTTTVSIMILDAECCYVVMPSAIYAKCRILIGYAECCYAECYYVKGPYEHHDTQHNDFQNNYTQHYNTNTTLNKQHMIDTRCWVSLGWVASFKVSLRCLLWHPTFQPILTFQEKNEFFEVDLPSCCHSVLLRPGRAFKVDKCQKKTWGYFLNTI